MRTKLSIGAVALGIVLAAPASAEDWDFILKNGTGKEVKSAQISVAGVADWKPGTFDSDVEKAGLRVDDRTSVHFDKAAKKCRYDVKLTFNDDSSETWPGLDVCGNTSFKLALKDGKPLVTN